ncbi:hypothetical protein Pelo_17394 [Pelomyxa schiedti]|nr:hypothetical protein Pelo_17394 [Pelomyxa schiedti]
MQKLSSLLMGGRGYGGGAGGGLSSTDEDDSNRWKRAGGPPDEDDDDDLPDRLGEDESTLGGVDDDYGMRGIGGGPEFEYEMRQFVRDAVEKQKNMIRVSKLGGFFEQFSTRWAEEKSLLSAPNSTESDSTTDLNRRLSKVTKLKEEGNKFYGSDKYSDALNYYSDALNLCTSAPENPLVTETTNILLSNIAAVFVKRQEWYDAISCTSQVLTFDPTNQKALYRRALSFFNVGKYTACRTDLEKCTREPLQPGAQINPAKAPVNHLWSQLTEILNKDNNSATCPVTAPPTEETGSGTPSSKPHTHQHHHTSTSSSKHTSHNRTHTHSHTHEHTTQLDATEMRRLLEEISPSDLRKGYTVPQIAQALNDLITLDGLGESELFMWTAGALRKLSKLLGSVEEYAQLMRCVCYNWNPQQISQLLLECSKLSMKKGQSWEGNWEQTLEFLMEFLKFYLPGWKRIIVEPLLESWNKMEMWLLADFRCALIPDLRIERQDREWLAWKLFYNNECDAIASKTSNTSFTTDDGRAIPLPPCEQRSTLSDGGRMDFIRLHAVATAHNNKEVIQQVEQCVPQCSGYNEGSTLLHHFSLLGRWAVVMFLLERGLRPTVLNDAGQTALDVVTSNCNVNVDNDTSPLSPAMTAQLGESLLGLSSASSEIASNITGTTTTTSATATTVTSSSTSTTATAGNRIANSQELAVLSGSEIDYDRTAYVLNNWLQLSQLCSSQKSAAPIKSTTPTPNAESSSKIVPPTDPQNKTDDSNTL